MYLHLYKFSNLIVVSNPLFVVSINVVINFLLSASSNNTWIPDQL